MSPDAEIIANLLAHVRSGELVLFVGNGVRRVPTTIRGAEVHENADDGLGPSWQRYMEGLWELGQHLGRSAREHLHADDLDFRAFSRLTAPRQAEWFDRRARNAIEKSEPLDASTIRMHFLGCDLHPTLGVPHNPLLALVAEIGLACWQRRAGGVDIVTTNVDCAIEQNLAWAIDQRDMPAPALKVSTAGGATATWRRAAAADGGDIRGHSASGRWRWRACLARCAWPPAMNGGTTGTNGRRRPGFAPSWATRGARGSRPSRPTSGFGPKKRGSEIS